VRLVERLNFLLFLTESVVERVSTFGKRAVDTAGLSKE